MLQQREDLVVDSVTGVDVTMPVAGPGARSFAFIIDWNIRTVLAAAWYIVAALLYHRSWYLVAPLTPDANWFVYVVAPTAAIYFLYHPVWEVATRGQTPGKRIVGIQTVSKDGGAPSVASVLIRNVFRLVDSFPFAYAVGLVTTLMTRNSVRIGDLAAGTLLVYSHRGGSLAQPARQLDINTAEVLADLLRRWDQLAPGARTRIAETLSPQSSTLDETALRSRLEALASGAAP